MTARALLVAALVLGSGCTAHLLAGVPEPSHDRPVVRVDTRGGSELGAATEDGILLLGRTAKEGPCRVHYYLGRTPVIEDGELVPFGGVFVAADIGLTHQRARFLDRELRDGDTPFALTPAGFAVVETALTPVRGVPGIEGDVVHWPGHALEVGTPVFVREGGDLLLVGLIAGEIEVGGARYLVHTGLTAVREALLMPRPQRPPVRVEHRPDDITVIRSR